MEKPERGILTIAYGAGKYLRMGRALARSIRRYHDQTPLAVVTDAPEYFGDVYDHTIPVDLSYGSGVTQKLYLDQYTPFGETLFVDSDCLFYGAPDPLWAFFAVDEGLGARSWGPLTHGDDCQGVGDFGRYLDYFGLEHIHNIKGGFYYFDDSVGSDEVFETARDILKRREEAGLTPFKNAPVADEVIIATALALHGIEPRPADAAPVNTFLGRTEPIELNVLDGKSRFLKNGTHQEPTAIHYGLGTQNGYQYLRDVNRLELEGAVAGDWRARARAAWEYTRYWGGRKWNNVWDRVEDMGLAGLLPGRVLRRLGIGDMKPLS
jgi:hypothetical protein